MATNLAIDEDLLGKALELGGYRTKKDTVNAALEEFIRRRTAKELVNLFGKIEYNDSYDYKKMRMR